MNLPKNKVRFYLILFLFLFIALYYNLFLVPVMEETRLYQRDISTFQESMTASENKQIEIMGIQGNRKMLQIVLSEKQARLTRQLDSHDLIYLMLKANADKLDRHSLIFLEPVSREDFCIIPVRFSFSTDNKGLSDFLSGLQGLPAQTTISYMQISTGEVSQSNQNEMDEKAKVRYNLEVEMTLNFFVRGIEE